MKRCWRISGLGLFLAVLAGLTVWGGMDWYALGFADFGLVALVGTGSGIDCGIDCGIA